MARRTTRWLATTYEALADGAKCTVALFSQRPRRWEWTRDLAGGVLTRTLRSKRAAMRDCEREVGRSLHWIEVGWFLTDGDAWAQVSALHPDACAPQRRDWWWRAGIRRSEDRLRGLSASGFARSPETARAAAEYWIAEFRASAAMFIRREFGDG